MTPGLGTLALGLAPELVFHRANHRCSPTVCLDDQELPSSTSTLPRVSAGVSRAASILATSIFLIVIMASKARFASSPPAASASMSVRGVICQESPQRSLHQPHALSAPPFLTMASQ